MSISITSKREGFRRCGVAHSKEPTTYKDGQFSEDELKILKAEPMLEVMHTGGILRPNVPDTVKLVEAAETLEALAELAKDESRKGVTEAIEKRKGELTTA